MDKKKTSSKTKFKNNRKEKTKKNNNKITFILLPLCIVIVVIVAIVFIVGRNTKKEISLNGAFILDYENEKYLGSDKQAYMIVVTDINPKKDILLDSITMTLNVGDKTVKGTKYDSDERSDIVYDWYKTIESNKSGKIAYIFKMEKYLYKENNSFEIEYKIGKQEGEYSYVLEGKMNFKKNKIKEVQYLEDIVKEVYGDNANDALMILSLKWKIEDVKKRANAYRKLDFYTQTNYQCYDMGARKDGQKILNYFANGTSNNISISNRGYLNVGVDSPEKTYDLPPLDYDVLEKYYPGIKEALTSLSKVTNEYANGLMNVVESGSGECYRDINILNIQGETQSVISVMNKNSK